MRNSFTMHINDNVKRIHARHAGNPCLLDSAEFVCILIVMYVLDPEECISMVGGDRCCFGKTSFDHRNNNRTFFEFAKTNDNQAISATGQESRFGNIFQLVLYGRAIPGLTNVLAKYTKVTFLWFGSVGYWDLDWILSLLGVRADSCQSESPLES